VVPPAPGFPPALLAPPVLAAPPDPGGGGGTLQVPRVDPGAVMQLEPTQQSALMVQAPPDGTQLVPPSGWS
jgi:hypothetical protein